MLCYLDHPVRFDPGIRPICLISAMMTILRLRVALAEISGCRPPRRAKQGNDPNAEPCPREGVAVDPGWPGKKYVFSCPPLGDVETPSDRLLRAQGHRGRAAGCSRARGRRHRSV